PLRQRRLQRRATVLDPRVRPASPHHPAHPGRQRHAAGSRARLGPGRGFLRLASRQLPGPLPRGRRGAEADDGCRPLPARRQARPGRRARALRGRGLAPRPGLDLPAPRARPALAGPPSAGRRIGGVTDVELVIRNGLVIDGTGAPRRRGDIGIAGDRIVAVGDLPGSARAREVDATDRVVAPGFIDAHTHDDRALLSMPDLTPKVSQGVTTLVAGNCGVSLAPLRLDGVPPPPLDLLGSEPGWFRFDRFGAFVQALGERPPPANCALLVGHITLRHRVMDRFDRAATAAEVGEMTEQVASAMVEGAIGFSTGLDYPSAVMAPTAEVRSLVAALKPYGGLYCSH